jgi:acetolactate synthase-1/3 small subunit
MALIDVEATAGERRQEVLSLVGVFRAKVVDISQTGMIIEASGNKEKVEAFIELLRPMGIRDITRTGCIAIGRISTVNGSAPVAEAEPGGVLSEPPALAGGSYALKEAT